tara:strand:+ start:183 stop:383 length:201 start_codon:yes stop_codon:yes gene_type:complete
MPISSPQDLKMAGDLGKCRGTLQNTLFWLNMMERNKPSKASSYAHTIRKNIERTLSEVPSFLGETE